MRWFIMSGYASIKTWSDMKETFLSKYQDYCKTRDLREELFMMTQKDYESLEDYVEWIHYNLQRSKHSDLHHEILNTIFIRGMRDDCLDMLNLLGKGDISQVPFTKIMKLYLRFSRGSSKGRSTIRYFSTQIQKSTSGGVTEVEIENLFEILKTDILSTLSTQIMTTQIKKARGEAYTTLAVFFLKCRKKHPLRDCEMNNISLCNICELEHSTGQCLELPRLKVVLRDSSGEVQSSYFIVPRRPWKPRPPGMSQDFSSFNSWNNAYNAQYPWQ